MIDILIVEDNEELAVLLRDFLMAEGYRAVFCQTGEEALELYERQGARLLVLDIMLPGVDGFSVCRKIRETSNTPILIVSARIEKEDKLNGLLLGADDYIEKPYDIDLLLAKIDGIFKRRYAQDVITSGGLTLNKVSRKVTRNGESVELRGKEFDLLLLLMENPKKPVHLVTVWGVGYKFE